MKQVLQEVQPYGALWKESPAKIFGKNQGLTAGSSCFACWKSSASGQVLMREARMRRRFLWPLSNTESRISQRMTVSMNN